MKKKLIFLISFITIFILWGVISNETFLLNYYQVKNLKNEKVNIPIPSFSYYVKEDKNHNVTFKTFRNFSSAKNIINKYIEHLPSCYDEGYFYDKDLDITISNYEVTNKKFINEITFTYTLGNYCENEYILEDNWYEIFNGKAKIEWSYFLGCTGESLYGTCLEKEVDAKIVNEIIDKAMGGNSTKLESMRNICIAPTNEIYSIDAAYVFDKQYYLLKIFYYNENLAFKIFDENDHAKNAIYDINEDAKIYLKNIFENI